MAILVSAMILLINYKELQRIGASEASLAKHEDDVEKAIEILERCESRCACVALMNCSDTYTGRSGQRLSDVLGNLPSVIWTSGPR